MSNPTTHELEQCLAKWAGVEITSDYFTHPMDPFTKRGPYWFWKGKYGSDEVWHPLTDANQMELVEEGLKKEGWGIVQEQDFSNDGQAICGGRVFKTPPGLDYPTVHRGYHAEKKTAFALAVWEMDQ